MTPGTGDALMIPGDAAPRGGWHLRILEGGVITQFYSETRNRSLSGYAKSTHVAGGSAPDAPLACGLSNVSSTLGLEIVLAAS